MSKTHDYTQRGWGHDFYIDEIINKGKKIGMGGWGHGIRKGDFLILPNQGTTTRYRVAKVEYHMAPSDMWRISAVHAPR